MGGPRTLSDKFNYRDKNEILNGLRANDIKIIGGKGKVTNKNKALISTIVDELVRLKNEHGISFDYIQFEDKPSANKNSALSTVFFKGGKTGLIIRNNILNKTLQDVNRIAKRNSKANTVTTRNVREMVMHEYGHVLHRTLMYRNPKAYKTLEHDLTNLTKYKKPKYKVSNYAQSNYKKTKNHMETVAESVVHILSGRRSRTGQYSVNTVKSAFEKNKILGGKSAPKATPKPVTKPTAPKPKKPNKSSSDADKLSYIFS